MCVCVYVCPHLDCHNSAALQPIWMIQSSKYLFRLHLGTIFFFFDISIILRDISNFRFIDTSFSHFPGLSNGFQSKVDHVSRRKLNYLSFDTRIDAVAPIVHEILAKTCIFKKNSFLLHVCR